MKLFGYGNAIELKDTKHGFTKVTLEDGQSMFVNATVVSEVSTNYQDTVKVGNCISDLMKSVDRKVTFEEVKEQLEQEFGLVQFN